MNQVTPPVARTFLAVVRYVTPTYAELRERFDWVNEDYGKLDFTDIDQCKDIDRKEREIVFACLHLNCTASTYDVLAEMDRQGFRPATYEELLAFTLAYPDEQRKHPIIAFGSMAMLDGKQHVACLGGFLDGGRGLNLDLYWLVGAWREVCRFLVVRR